MTLGSPAASGMCVGAMLCVFAQATGMAGQFLSLRPPDGFVVEKVSAVPAMTVRAMVQTHDGYLWFGSYDGLYRFDGVRVATFNFANTPSLSSDTIRALHEDRSGNLWIGTDDAGLMRFRDGKFFRIGPEQGLTETEVHSLCEDRDGTIWIGTRRGLFFLKDQQLAAKTAADVLAMAVVDTLGAAPNGALWIGSSQGLFRLERGSFEPEAVLTNENVRSLAIDSNGVVWATMDSRTNYRIEPRGATTEIEFRPTKYWWLQQERAGGLWLVVANGALFHSSGPDLYHATKVAQFDRPDITSICDDTDGNTWVGIESHGLYRLRRKRVTMLTAHDGIPTENVSTILEDSRGRVWLGTFGHGMLVASDERLPFEPHPVPSVSNITGLHETREGTLWFGTFNGDRFRSDGSQFVVVTDGSRGCRVVYEDRDGAIWIGTLQNGLERRKAGELQRFTTRDGLSSDRITCLVQDIGGDLWIGAHRGLNRISGGKISHFTGDEVLRNRTIRGLYADRDGSLWIASLGGGLMRYHKQRLQTITSRNGLPSDSIEDVIEDNEGRMWLATSEGIACVQRDELVDCAEGRKSFLSCITLGTEDGMVLARCGTGFKPSCMKSRSGSLWFCTGAGMVVVDPATIKPRPRPPPVYIEEVLSDDRPVRLQPSVKQRGAWAAEIRPGTSRVGFRYTALSLSAPEKVQLRYRLEGYDNDWVSARGAREAYYTRLPVGTYRFRVLATGEGGASTETGATLAVTVLPSWWQTWWFRGLAMIAFAGLIFGFYEWRIHQHRIARAAQEAFSRRLIASQEQERKRVAGELHDSLGQSLQVIKGRAQLGLNRAADPSESAKQFAEISNAAGQAIQEVRTISHALRPAELDQLGLARAVEWLVEQAGTASPTRFACEVEAVDGIPSEMEISLYRMAQEGINNVLKHAQAREAILELRRDANTVRLSIFDNGRGLVEPARPDGHGLAGITERVRLLGGAFDVQSTPGRGTRLTATIPVRSNEG